MDLDVMLLAAGHGTRLLPLTRVWPKPLAWLGDRPQIDHVLSVLERACVKTAFMNTHHLAESFQSTWRAPTAVRVITSHEETILGTAGGIAKVRDGFVHSEVLVWNGDIWADISVERMLQAHLARPSLATLAVGPERLAVGTGTVGLSLDDRVVRLRGVTVGVEHSSANFAGISILDRALTSRLPDRGCLVQDGFIPALEGSSGCGAFFLDRPFIDVGTPADLLAANLAWLEASGKTSYVHPLATVAEGARLDRVVIGPSAVVEGSVTLSRALILPGSVVRENVLGGVVGPWGTTV